ncbi:MAG: hypothetical protein RMX68_011270 [Aulosira sp. ZfuVER01]
MGIHPPNIGYKEENPKVDPEGNPPGGLVFLSGQLPAKRQTAKSEGKKCNSSFRLLIGYLLA